MAVDATYTNEERRVLRLLSRYSYDTVRERTGWSRGRIWRLAIRAGARKNEERIRERAAERKRRQKEAFQEIMNTTVKADVLDFLDGLPDDSVQLVVTSPPYNVGKKYGEGAGSDVMRHVYYHGWLMMVVSEIARVLRPGGTVCLQAGKTYDETGHLYPIDVMVFEDLKKAGLTFQNRIVWPVPHGLTPKGRLADRHEVILVFSKGERPLFNPNAIRIPQKQPGKRAFKGPNQGKLSGHPLGAWPTDVWADLGNVGHNHPERRHGGHPAQFPVKLAKRAVLAYTLPGDVVCDPFSGSGSSQIAALLTGRAFVGADLFYEDLREKRLAEVMPDVATPLAGVTNESVAVWQAEAVTVRTDARPLAPGEEKELFLDLFASGEAA